MISGNLIFVRKFRNNSKTQLAGARQASSTTNYELAQRKGIDWYSRREIDPFYCDINPVLDFFGKLFQVGYKFRTIGCHSSAISACHRLINGLKVGVHTRVSELMKAVFNKCQSLNEHSCSIFWKSFRF